MEALAAASSVFAVVSLALQLGFNIQRLIDFWESNREAPDEVIRIKSHLRVLRTLLRRIEIDAKQYPGQDCAEIARDCLCLCTDSIVKLESLTNEFDNGLNGSEVRRRTPLRKAVRRKQLSNYWLELEHAKSTLIMYQGWMNG
jgi:hypothetical protein